MTKTLTFDTIISKLREIEESISDPKKAHLLEDELYVDFVRFIEYEGDNVDGKELQHLASIVLKSFDIDFPRYTA